MIEPTYPKSFASDNHAGVHPAILDAITAVNHGDAPAYGDDALTAAFGRHIKDVFGPRAEGFPVLNGAGANMVGLALMLGRYDAVVCPATAHIASHETGAAERLLGTKLITIPTPDGKLRPDDLAGPRSTLGNHHDPQPRVVSISQVTELGTCYSPAELAALADAAHAAGMRLHVDGARLANAAAYLDCSLSAITTDVGVDVFSFGGTKNGALAAEAAIILDPTLTEAVPYLRRQSLQLASKMRFVSAQLSALLTDDLWHRNASHANAMAARLADGLASIPQITLAYPVESNAVFATVPPAVAAALQEHFLLLPPDESTGIARWMTSYDTTPADVDAFLDALRKAAS